MTEQTKDELTLLKERADKMGIEYHPSIGLDKLKEKVNAKLAESVLEGENAPTNTKVEGTSKTAAQKRVEASKEARKLVRVNIVCMNPAKKDWEGELFTVSNAVVGTIKRYVPFNTPDGWHIEQMLLNVMRDRQCQNFITVKDGKGNKVRKGKLIKEFNIELLPALKEKELNELKQRQAMSGSIEE